MATLFVPEGIPSAEALKQEGLSIMSDKDTPSDVKNIILLNLMPLKESTERHVFRLFSEADGNIRFILVRTFSYTSKNTTEEYLQKYYIPLTAPQIQNGNFDGLIVTGAPVEHLDFTQVVYWDELKMFFEWSKTHVKSVYGICWGAQAALKSFYGIEKHLTKDKLFGLFDISLTEKAKNNVLFKGVPMSFTAPQSRYAYNLPEDVEKDSRLLIAAAGTEAGMHIVVAKDNSLLCVFGHPEYDRETLSAEYFRDLNKGEEIVFPHNYFINDNPSLLPEPTWQKTGRIIAANWINNL